MEKTEKIDIKNMKINNLENILGKFNNVYRK